MYNLLRKNSVNAPRPSAAFLFPASSPPLHATEVVGKPIFGQQQFTQLLSEPGCCFFFAGPSRVASNQKRAF